MKVVESAPRWALTSDGAFLLLGVNVNVLPRPEAGELVDIEIPRPVARALVDFIRRLDGGEA
jgi:hypothetical protein